MNKIIWVYIEVVENEIVETSLEALSEGHRLAESAAAHLAAVMIGNDTDRLAETVLQHGAATLYAIETKSADPPSPAGHAAALAGLIRDHGPDVLLFGGTLFGNDLAVYLAAELQTGLAKNCDKLAFSEKGILEQHRLCFENKVHTIEVTPQARPQMATIEPGIVKIGKASKPYRPGGPEIIRTQAAASADVDAGAAIHLGFIPADPRTIDISDASIIVAGGNAAKDVNHFAPVRELADCLGAAVAGSRAAVDNGCIGRDRQIGQSGKTVAPDLMISCGISGAHAHTIGMKGSKTIIAINSDKNAPIHKMADLGVVGDMHGILPELIKRLKTFRTTGTQDGLSDPKMDGR